MHYRYALAERRACACQADIAPPSEFASQRAAGRLAELRIPVFLRSPVFRLYSLVYGCDLQEAALDVREFDTFQAFFTRRLKPNARPIAQDGLVPPVVGGWRCGSRRFCRRLPLTGACFTSGG